MKVLNISWLGSCLECGHDGSHKVETAQGNSRWLYDGDKVTCGSCGHKGFIECNDRVAEVIWDEDDV